MELRSAVGLRSADRAEVGQAGRGSAGGTEVGRPYWGRQEGLRSAGRAEVGRQDWGRQGELRLALGLRSVGGTEVSGWVRGQQAGLTSAGQTEVGRLESKLAGDSGLGSWVGNCRPLTLWFSTSSYTIQADGTPVSLEVDITISACDNYRVYYLPEFPQICFIGLCTFHIDQQLTGMIHCLMVEEKRGSDCLFSYVCTGIKQNAVTNLINWWEMERPLLQMT